jgi:hypothetical protein
MAQLLPQNWQSFPQHVAAYHFPVHGEMRVAANGYCRTSRSTYMRDEGLLDI